MADNQEDCRADTCHEPQIGDRGIDLISDTADSGNKGEDICNVDTSCDMIGNRGTDVISDAANSGNKEENICNVDTPCDMIADRDTDVISDAANSGNKEENIGNVDTPCGMIGDRDAEVISEATDSGNKGENICDVDTPSDMVGDRGTDVISDAADSVNKGENICHVDTPSDVTKDKTPNHPKEPAVTENVSTISYSIEEVVCITGAWKDFRLREECFTKGCKWAPDGTCVVTNSADNILRVYDLPPELHCQATWEKDRSLSELKSVLSISVGRQVYDYSWYPLMSSWNPLSCCLVTTSKDNPVHMWDAFTGELRCTYRCFNPMDEIVTPHCVSFDTTGEKLYCGLKDIIKIFDTNNPGRNCDTRNLKMPMYQNETKIGIVSCIAVNPNLSSVYAVGTYLKTVGLYSEPDGQLLCFLKGQKGGVTHIAFSPDGTKLLSGGRKDPEIICWDLRNPGTVLFVLQREVATNQRIYFDISPNGCYVMSGGTNGIVKIWDIQRPPDTSLGDPVLHPLKTFVAHDDCVNGLSIHKQFPVLATSSGQRHFEDPFSDSSSDSDQSPSECDSDCRITKVKVKRKSENSLKLWWVGPKKQ